MLPLSPTLLAPRALSLSLSFVCLLLSILSTRRLRASRLDGLWCLGCLCSVSVVQYWESRYLSSLWFYMATSGPRRCLPPPACCWRRCRRHRRRRRHCRCRCRNSEKSSSSLSPAGSMCGRCRRRRRCYRCRCCCLSSCSYRVLPSVVDAAVAVVSAT